MSFMYANHRDDGRTDPSPVLEVIVDKPDTEYERILDHRYSTGGHQRRLAHLLSFTGFAAEHDMWQGDVLNHAELVQECWYHSVPLSIAMHLYVQHSGKRPTEELKLM